MTASMKIITEARADKSVEQDIDRRILIVDDSEVQRQILKQSLNDWGYSVVEADTGDNALRLCQEEHFDLVLSDWIMPGMDGIEFCNAFRELPDTDYGYFILLTTKSQTTDIATGLEAGADDFLTKPVDQNELRARIAAGERILRMQRELRNKNQLLSQTLEELKRAHDSIDSDLREAKKLQQSLIPIRHQVFPQGTVSLALQSSGHVGGDLVGFFQDSFDHLCIYSIDVSGHGISSALMTAHLSKYLSATAHDQNIALKKERGDAYRIRAPYDVLDALNKIILEDMETEHYVTILMADIDLRTGYVRIAQGGHPHPVVQRSNGRVEQNAPGGFPVGLLDQAVFGKKEIQLNPGDRLFLLSDGVTECPNRAGELLGETGLARLLVELRDTGGIEMFDQLIHKLKDHAGNDSFPDDVSGIVFEFYPKQT